MWIEWKKWNERWRAGSPYGWVEWWRWTLNNGNGCTFSVFTQVFIKNSIPHEVDISASYKDTHSSSSIFSFGHENDDEKKMIKKRNIASCRHVVCSYFILKCHCISLKGNRENMITNVIIAQKVVPSPNPKETVFWERKTRKIEEPYTMNTMYECQVCETYTVHSSASSYREALVKRNNKNAVFFYSVVHFVTQNFCFEAPMSVTWNNKRLTLRTHTLMAWIRYCLTVLNSFQYLMKPQST